MRQSAFPICKYILSRTVLIALSLAACSPASQADAHTQAAETDTLPSTAPDSPIATEPPAAPGQDINHPAPMSEAVTTAGWEIRVVEVLRGEAALARLEEVSSFNGAPEEPGLEWAVLRIHASRVGDSPEEMRIAKSFFSSAGSDGTLYDRPKITEVTNPEPELDAVLEPGGESEGWITVFAPQGDRGVVLVIQPYVYNGDTGMSTGPDDRRYILLGP
jgi:hypothetical protein